MALYILFLFALVDGHLEVRPISTHHTVEQCLTAEKTAEHEAKDELTQNMRFACMQLVGTV